MKMKSILKFVKSNAGLLAGVALAGLAADPAMASLTTFSSNIKSQADSGLSMALDLAAAAGAIMAVFGVFYAFKLNREHDQYRGPSMGKIAGMVVSGVIMASIPWLIGQTKGTLGATSTDQTNTSASAISNISGD